MWLKTLVLSLLVAVVLSQTIEEFKCEDCKLCSTLNNNNYGTDASCEENCGLCPLCFLFDIQIDGCKWCQRNPGDKYGVENCKKLCLKGEENCSATGPCQTKCGFRF